MLFRNEVALTSLLAEGIGFVISVIFHLFESRREKSTCGESLWGFGDGCGSYVQNSGMISRLHGQAKSGLKDAYLHGGVWRGARQLL